MTIWRVLIGFVLISFLVCSVTFAGKSPPAVPDEENMHLETCEDQEGGGLDEDTMCVGSGLDPSMEHRDLEKCRCPKGKVCNADVPEIQIIPEGGTEPENPYVYKCKTPPEETAGKEYNMGMFLDGGDKDTIEVVEEKVIEEVVEEYINKAAEEAAST